MKKNQPLFTQAGIGSRGYWLSLIKDFGEKGATTQGLADRAKSTWAKTNEAIVSLKADGFVAIVNPGAGGWTRYEITQWAEPEIKSFNEWQGETPLAPVLPLAEDQKDTAGTGNTISVPAFLNDEPIHHIPVEPKPSYDQFKEKPPIGTDTTTVSKPRLQEEPLPVEAEPLRRNPELSTTSKENLQDVDKPDPYIVAYHELLEEEYGSLIKFVDIQRRMKKNNANL